MIPSVAGAPRISWRTPAILILGWVSAPTLLALWVRTPIPELRDQLRVLQFWSLEICFVLLVVLGGLTLRALVRVLDRQDTLRLAALAALAAGLVLFVAPRTNRIFYDEHIYQAVGQNLADLKLAQMCNDGTVEYGRLQCWIAEYNKQPYAYPHLLSLGYRVFGVSESLAWGVNAVVMALTVCAVYLLVLSVFGDRLAAFFAGLLLALTPHQILWSATAAVEPAASLACVVALLFASQFRRSGSTVALAATAVAAAYALQFRPESFLIVPVIGLLLWPRLRDETRRPRFWAIGLLAFALLAVHFAHLVAVRNEGWGTTDARMSLAYVVPNLQVNGSFYLGDQRFPLIFTLLAIVGLFDAPFRGARWTFGVYFLLFFVMYLLFYAGSYDYGADVRYSLLTYPPISVLGGLGASRAAQWLSRMAPGIRPVGVATAGLIFQFLWYAPVVRATTEEAWAARADVRYAREFARGLSRNAYVFTQNPGMFHLWGINAGQMSLLVRNPGQLEFTAVRYGGGGVYLHWNYWCNVPDPVQQRFCSAALAGREAHLVREHLERDQRFALYSFKVSIQQD